MSPSDLPPLDCHAHIAPDVTGPQIAALNGALLFAMTRTPGEARAAARRSDQTLAWGFGARPSLPDASSRVNETVLREAVQAHVVMGQIGLDRRGPDRSQHEALEAILDACHAQPVVLSLHSTGRTRQLLDVPSPAPASWGSAPLVQRHARPDQRSRRAGVLAALWLSRASTVSS